MTKVLMTGITGLVGSAFVTELFRRDDKIKLVALVRGPGNGRGNRSGVERARSAIVEQCEFDNCPELAEKFLERIEVVQTDLSDIDDLLTNIDSFQDCDVIFHCAADVNLGKDPDGKTFRNNYDSTKNMMGLAKLISAKALHVVSTAYVAGKLVGRAMEEMPAENTEFNNSYEKSKFYSEMLVRSSDIPFTIYRPGIVVGRRSDGRIRRPLAFYRILEFLAKMKKHQCSKHGVKAADWLDLHLRLEAYPSDKVYFVPIDYVQKVITDLFFCKVENQTYHITGDSPVKTTDISEVTSPILKVTGVTVEEKVENPSMDEKLVQRFLGDLLPYFSSQTVFDQSNIIAKLGKEVLDWKLDLNILIGEFYKDNYPELH